MRLITIWNTLTEITTSANRTRIHRSHHYVHKCACVMCLSRAHSKCRTNLKRISGASRCHVIKPQYRFNVRNERTELYGRKCFDWLLRRFFICCSRIYTLWALSGVISIAKCVLSIYRYVLYYNKTYGVQGVTDWDTGLLKLCANL